jgi:preprotein translocase subunit SecG
MLYYVALTIYVLVCLTLILVVLLQQGKGGSMANAFGGGATQAAFGARSGATVLSRATTVCAVLFVIGALYIGIAGQKGPSSVVGGRAPQSKSGPATPAAPAPTTKPAPAQSAPTTPAPAPVETPKPAK